MVWKIKVTLHVLHYVDDQQRSFNRIAAQERHRVQSSQLVLKRQFAWSRLFKNKYFELQLDHAICSNTADKHCNLGREFLGLMLVIGIFITAQAA